MRLSGHLRGVCVGWSAQINELLICPHTTGRPPGGWNGESGYVEDSGLAGELWSPAPSPPAGRGSSLVDSSLTLLCSCSPFNHGHRVAKFYYADKVSPWRPAW